MNKQAARLRIELMPKWLLCIPLVAQWFWLGARFRSLTLPSAINPGIETGGLAGESKSTCLALIPPVAATWVAKWQTVSPGQDPHACREASALPYPLIAKPDIGWCGYGVRRIDTDQELADYHAAFPDTGSYILQRYIADPMEAGLFYVRPPSARHGQLLSVTIRHAPSVTGDGTSSISTLLAANPGLRHLAAALSPAKLAQIPAPGEQTTLTTVASLRVGATYENASAQASCRLLARIDTIARAMPGFHLGRFDVRFATLAHLQRGHFTIIEVNGAGSEAIHLWDPATPIAKSFAGVFAKQTLLFQLGAAMRKLGHQPVGILTLARAWIRQQRLIAQYPASN